MHVPCEKIKKYNFEKEQRYLRNLAELNSKGLCQKFYENRRTFWSSAGKGTVRGTIQ